MFVQFYLESNNHSYHSYHYDKVNLVDISNHKFPSGRNRKCLTFVLDNGTTVNFPLSEVADLCIEDYADQRHPFNDDAKVIFVEDGQTYEKR